MTVRDPAGLVDILCIEEERVVARDNTVAYRDFGCSCRKARLRAHYVKARVKLRQYPDGTLAVFHGPRLLARYDASRPAHRKDQLEGCRVNRFDAQLQGPCGFVDNATRLPTSSTSQSRNKQKRTSDVLPKPDNLKSYRQGRCEASPQSTRSPREVPGFLTAPARIR